MIRAACTAGPLLICERLWFSPYVAKNIVQRACVSTNTAIHRGIRRSNSRSGRDESGSRYDKSRDGIKPNAWSGRHEPTFRNGEAGKERRFNPRPESVFPHDGARGERRFNPRQGRSKPLTRRKERRSNTRNSRPESVSRFDDARKERGFDPRESRPESVSRFDSARQERGFNPRESRPESVSRSDNARQERGFNPRESRPESVSRFDNARQERGFNPRESRPGSVARYDEHREERTPDSSGNRPESVFRLDEVRKQRFTAELQKFGTEDKSSGPWASRPPKSPRPNHQAQHDVEDIRQLANSRIDRRTTKQKNYLRGGARNFDNTLDTSRRSRFSGPETRGFRRTSDEFRGKPPASTRYEKAISSTYNSNEATRRTPKFEYSSDKPQGFQRPSPTSALPNNMLRSPQRQDRDTSRGNQSDRSSPFKRQKEEDYQESHIYGNDPPPSIQELKFAADNNLNLFEDNDSFNESGRKGSEDYQVHNRDSTNSGGPRAFTINRVTRNNDSSSLDTNREGVGNSAYPRKNFMRSNEPQAPENVLIASSKAPYGTLAIPYTTPASEFLYGTSVVTAALKSRRRRVYKLYIYSGENREAGDQDESLRKLALVVGVQVIEVQGDGLRLMDKMSTGRPHNGYILEASPLQKLPVIGLQQVEEHYAALNVFLDHQSREDEVINGTDSNIKYKTGFSRYPLILFLDGILDPGNLGAILRTAFFLGVDAVAISTRNSAPLSPVAIKASAGACESIPLLSVSQPEQFIDNSRSNGWKFYSAAAPSPYGSGGRRPYRNTLTTSTLGHPTQQHPCVVMFGGEGEGLRRRLQRKADFTVGAEGYRAGHGGVDSLNVSVAAGLLCDAFMRKPPANALSASRQSPQGPPANAHSTRPDDQDYPDEPPFQHRGLESSFDELKAAIAQASDLVAGEEDFSVELTPRDLDEDSISVDKHRLF